MGAIRTMPTAGFVVIVIIAALFALAVVLLLYVYARYKALTLRAEGDGETGSGFRGAILQDYIAAYRKYGADVNTPAIISEGIARRLSGLLLCERFLNNAVSLFVTLGLFGTFLGLSLSVSSLTELIGYSNTSEWLSVLDSVGGGLMSALGGMGVAFYTSLAGAACSIVLTVLRTIFSPQAQRERLETRLELWLDTEIAPGLYTEAAADDATLVKRMIGAMERSAEGVSNTLQDAASSYINAMQAAAGALTRSVSANREAIESFDRVVSRFNDGVHDFSEVDYNLRGSVERMDLAVRDLSGAMREINRRMGVDIQ